MSEQFLELKLGIEKERKLIQSLHDFFLTQQKTRNKAIAQKIEEHLQRLILELTQISKDNLFFIEHLSLVKPLPKLAKTDMIHKKKEEYLEAIDKKKVAYLKSLERLSDLDKTTIKRIKKRKKKEAKTKKDTPSTFVNLSSKIFYDLAASLLKQFKSSEKLKRDLIKSNMRFLPESYLSVVLFSTLISFGVALLLYNFFLFFTISATFPIIMPTAEATSVRAVKFLWLFILLPLATFLFGYFYPSFERSSLGRKIDAELPFATIHMSAISGSMINPIEIFRIISQTLEYPHLGKEFVKLVNETKIYGYDIVSSLRKIAFNTPSKKLSELLNGLAITITSGGNLPQFFEKRSQTLLFEHRIEREKRIKTSETFMDIYISIVIAAPMILMLVLIMMKISGLGISLSTSLITLIMVVGVSVVNIIFLVFLYVKQSSE